MKIVMLTALVFVGANFLLACKGLPGTELSGLELKTVFGQLPPTTKCTDTGIPCTAAAGAGCGVPNQSGVCYSAGNACGTCSGSNDKVCRFTKEQVWCNMTPLKHCCDLPSCTYNGGTITVPPSCTCTNTINMHAQVTRNGC